MIEKINYPEKHIGDKFTHGEANEIKNAINNNADVLSTVVENTSNVFSPATGTSYKVLNINGLEIKAEL